MAHSTRTQRDDFSNDTKDTLAKRVAMRCSNPSCRKPTSGPREDPTKAVNIGVAAHIAAASPGGPRYDETMTHLERGSIENGIWLCQNCAKLVDNDTWRYSARALRRWKHLAERSVQLQLESSAKPVTTIASVNELIALVEIRAGTIIKEMDERKTDAIREFEKELAQKQSSHSNNPREPSESSFSFILDVIDPWHSIESAEELSLQLAALRQSFVELHKLHKYELCNGRYAAAHEVVGEIHRIIDKFWHLTSPARRDFVIMSSLCSYCGLRWYSSEIDNTISNQCMYPGLLPKGMAARLPKKLEEYNLFEADEPCNRDKASKWIR
jgi:hypothetical protein